MGIRIHEDNHWYWEIDGRPTLLLGGSDEDNPFQFPDEELRNHLEKLSSVGGNYIRNVLSDRDEGNVKPFAIENGLYDLETWNENYWDRLERFLSLTQRHGIVVHLTLWDQHDQIHDENWEESPWRPANNCTYSEETSGLPNESDAGFLEEWAFFRSVDRDLDRLLELQERFIRQVLSIALEYDHVLYNVGNESWTTLAWDLYWASVIAESADDAGTNVPITSMRLSPDESVERVLNYPDDFSFADISQNNQDARGRTGEAHWAWILERRSELIENDIVRPLGNVKIYGGRKESNFVHERAGTADEAVERFWRNLFGGCASARFHRREGGWGIGFSKRAQHQIRSARLLEEAFDLISATPNADSLNGTEENEAYCASCPGEYAVYFPDGGRVELALDSSTEYTTRWLDLDKSKWEVTEKAVAESGELSLDSPGSGGWIVVVTSD